MISRRCSAPIATRLTRPKFGAGFRNGRTAKENLQNRPASVAEFQIAIDWAAAEGWKPGHYDLAAFHAADPDGFLIGFLGDDPVSSISVVRYGDAYGFLGFYTVHPDHCGTGAGIATWCAGMNHLSGRCVGLDGVVDQQGNYRKSGFVLVGRNVRHTGIPVPGDVACISLRPSVADDLDRIVGLDRRYFPADRSGFITVWVLPRDPSTRR